MSVRIIRHSKAETALRETVRKRAFLHYPVLKIKEAGLRLLQPALFTSPAVLRKVYIETAGGCNLACPFCPASGRDPRQKAAVMDQRLFERVIDGLLELDFKGSVAFHCNNEPLLDQRLESLVSHARRNLAACFFYMYTNGTLLTPGRCAGLFKAGLDLLIIDNYDASQRYTPEVEALLKSKEAGDCRIVVKVRPSREYLGNRAGQSPNAGKNNSAPLKLVCGRPFAELAIAADGSVPICCCDCLGRTIVGSAERESLAALWMSETMRKIRGALANGNRGCCRACAGCDALDFIEIRGAESLWALRPKVR